jgi:hypothetical protein
VLGSQLATLANVLKISQDDANRMLEEEQNQITPKQTHIQPVQLQQAQFSQVQTVREQGSNPAPVNQKRRGFLIWLGGGFALAVLFAVFINSGGESPQTSPPLTASTSESSQSTHTLKTQNIKIEYFQADDTETVAAALESRLTALAGIWAERAGDCDTERLAAALRVELTAAALDLFERLYPGALQISPSAPTAQEP